MNRKHLKQRREKRRAEEGACKLFFLFWFSITQSSFKVLFRNTNYVTDQLNKFQSGARLEPAAYSPR
jgi:hypothetical protein